MDIHGKLSRLKRLNLADHICRLYQVDADDLELLATIEETLTAPSTCEADHGA